MTNIVEENKASLSIEGLETAKHRISSEILSRIIEGFQRVAWILGAASEGQVYDKRCRFPSEFKERHKIEWGLSVAGSYVLPLYQAESIQEGQTVQHVDLSKIYGIFSAISSQRFEDLKQILPDSRLREKLLETLKYFLPRSWENWQIKYVFQDRPPASLDQKSYSIVKTWYSESLSSRKLDEVLTIKGDLLRIDFEAHKVLVRYPPTHRPIECYYLPEIEDSILESRKELIEVTGRFVLDNEGHPERLSEVSVIQPVDLSEMILSKFEQADQQLIVLNKPLTLKPFLDEETSQLYVLEDKLIGIHVSASTREELMESLTDQIFFLWDTYGRDDVAPDNLTTKANILRKELRKRFKETFE